MTIAVYTKREDSHVLTISGHAGYDEYGKDIVCASVSAIAWTLCGYLANNGGEYEADSGDFYAEAKRAQEIDTAFEMAVLGLLQIAKRYPQYVDVQIATPGS